MVSRRAMLALLGGSLGGCLGDRDETTEPTGQPAHSPTRVGEQSAETPPSEDPDETPDPNVPPERWPPEAWTPEWTHRLSVTHVVGLDAVDGRLVVTATDNRGTTVVQSYDPRSRSVQWSREFRGEAVENAMVDRPQGHRNWGVTAVGDTLLTVTGRASDQQWSELHALDAETGEVRWSLRRKRTLLVRGLHDGGLYVLARAFRATPTGHYHGSATPTPEPLEAAVLAVDIDDGSVRWRRAFTGVDAVAADDAGVYVVEMNRLLGFDHGGTRRWSVQGNARGEAVFAGPSVVYFVSKPSWNSTVVRGVGHGGAVRWRHRFDADEAVRRGGRLYVAGDRLQAVRPDGTTAGSSPGYAGRLTFGPAGERVYVRTGRQADAVSPVDLGDGSRAWTFDPPIDNAWPESATEETVVAGGIGDTGDGVGQPLYRVDASSGEASARYVERDPITTRPLGDHVFVGAKDYEDGGRVLALPL
jgi:outer membrane protein assembly factor BamB